MPMHSLISLSSIHLGVQGDGAKEVNVGIAGSLTMILLCTGVAFLCLSFYRRYKRALSEESLQNDHDEESK